jgi:hypothetical protein
MKIVFTFLLLFLLQSGIAQSLAFESRNFGDSLLIEKNMPLLAIKVIQQYESADKKAYYNNLYKLQALAKQYDQEYFYHVPAA